MKKWMTLLLAMAMLLGLCACDNAPDTENPPAAPTTQGQSGPTNPTEPSAPSAPSTEAVSPVGIYRLTGLSTESPDTYHEMGYGELCIYADGTGVIYFDDYYHDFVWFMEEGKLIANTTDESGIAIEGILKDGMMELVYENNIYLRFQLKTQQELEQESVDYLRDCMADSKMTMAVAYLGWYEGDEDLDAWLNRTCPKILEEYPFIANIPQERIVGDRGEVYILVPKEPDAQMDIHLLAEDTAEVTGTLYESETGEPVLLMCNYSGAYPNTCVTVAGGSLEFYPQLGDMGGVVIPINDGLEKLMFDFSDYFEVTQDYYQGMLANGWRLTDEDYLISTCWIYYEDAPEDRCWLLNINGDSVQLELLVDGVTVEAQHCEGTWALNYSDDDGLTYLFVNMLRADGEPIAGEYVVLQSPNEPGILLGIQEGQEQLPVPCEEDASFWWGSVG